MACVQGMCSGAWGTQRAESGNQEYTTQYWPGLESHQKWVNGSDPFFALKSVIEDIKTDLQKRECN